MVAAEDRWRLVRETVGDGRLSVIMPFYNLASSAAQNLRRTAELFESYGVRTEIIPVDDGSSDSTAQALEGFSKTSFSYVVIAPVLMPSNGGKGAALRAGFEASSGEYVMLLDGDLDILPDQTPEFFMQMLQSSADIVVGSKRHPDSKVQYPWHRRIVSWAYFSLVRIFIGLPITDTQTGMKLFRRDILGYSLSRMLVKAYAFDLELLSIASQRGAKIVEAPVVINFGYKFGALKFKTIKTMAIDSLAVFYRLRILRYYAKVEIPPKLNRDIRITVVIACPGRSAVLDECLNALASQTYRNYEVIVLPDENIQLHQSLYSCGMDLKVVVTGKVRPAEKRNIGIMQATGEVVAFIDDDAYPHQSWLEYAVKYFSDLSIGAVGGPGVTPPNDTFLCEAGGCVYENILVSGNYRYRYIAGGVKRDVDDYPSCNLFVRTDLLKRINGYRTDFWPGEDTLLCKDIVDAGMRIVYDPWIVVYHHRRALFAPHLRQLGRYAFHRGYFCKKYPSNSLHFSYFVPSLFVAYLCVESAALLFYIFAPSMPCVFNALMCLSCIPLGVYLLALVVTSFSRNPLKWILVCIGVLATHIVYGVRFIQGLAAKKAPCEFIGKDHAA